jgi:eukaryotic-like serine/threonine-protein kinase
MTPERLMLADDLVQAALSRKPEQRAAFIDEACAGDDELRQEVESLLAHDLRADNFLEEPAMQRAAPWFVAAEQVESLIGRRIGHYKIVSSIGKGGMGEVYLADDLSLSRKVALKLLPSYSTLDPNRVRRFSQEAKAASALNHPNIITIYEISKVGEFNFIATEFITGQTLRRLIAQGQLKTAEVLEIGIQVSSALVAAHEVGIVHRDIKPENVMIRPDGLVKVLDFGLAKLLESPADESGDTAPTKEVSTISGSVMGTVRYMSPEQARGQTVDGQTDIFSLGAVLYEMITGRPAFKCALASEEIAAILEREPRPINEFSEIPEALEKIVSKALAKNCAERYETAESLLTDLRALKEELNFAARLERSNSPQTGPYKKTAMTARQPLMPSSRTSSFSRSLITRPARVIADFKGTFATAIVIVLITVGFAYWYYKRPVGTAPQIDSIAVMPFVNASGNPEVEWLSDGMTDSLIARLSQLANLSVKAHASVFRYKASDAAPQQVARELHVQAIVNGRVLEKDNTLMVHVELVDVSTETAIWSEDYSRSMDNLLALQSEIASEIARKLRLKLSGADQQKLAKKFTSNNEANQLYLRGRAFWNLRTEEGMTKGLKDFQHAIELDPNYALAYAGVAESYIVLEYFGFLEPKEAFPKAREAATKALEIDDTLGEAHTALARVRFEYDWDSAGAESEYKRALELNPNYPTAHQWYAHYLSAKGRHAEAISECKRALELDPLSEIINLGLAFNGYFQAREYDHAIQHYLKTLEIHPGSRRAHTGLMWSYLQKGMYDEAFAELLKYGPPTPAADLKQAYAVGGWHGVWRRQLETVFDESKSNQFYVPPMEAARLYSLLGENDHALEWLEKALHERNSALVYLKVDARWDNLRSDSRFTDLLRRIGLWS